MALKNQAIANANPGSVANRAYIDALYKEAYGRYATDAEYNRFKSSTVKDAANTILGQSLSPFATQKPDATNNPAPIVTATKTNTPSNQQATLSSPDGKYKVAVTVGSTEATKLQANGWSLGTSGKTATDTTTALAYKPTAGASDNAGGAGAGAGNGATPTGVPDAIKNDSYYQQLDATNKSIVDYYYSTLASGNTDKTAAFQKALDLASAQADPYWREKINIVKDELSRNMGTLDADLASREKTLMDRQAAINEDLTTNKAYLTTEQQAELARQAESYDTDLSTVRDRMASTGLSSSSIRNRAESKLATANADVINSSKRTYEKKIADLNTSATRELATIAQQTADYQRSALADKTTKARTAEAQLGSAELSNTNYAPLLMGNISGSLLDTKGTDILNRTKALMSDSYNTK